MVLGVIPGLILPLGGIDTLGLWRSLPPSRVILPIIGIACFSPGLTSSTKKGSEDRDL
jgi:hypothetical protein